MVKKRWQVCTIYEMRSISNHFFAPPVRSEAGARDWKRSTRRLEITRTAVQQNVVFSRAQDGCADLLFEFEVFYWHKRRLCLPSVRRSVSAVPARWGVPSAFHRHAVSWESEEGTVLSPRESERPIGVQGERYCEWVSLEIDGPKSSQAC